MDFFSHPGNAPTAHDAANNDTHSFADAVNSRFPSTFVARLDSPTSASSITNMSLSARRSAKPPSTSSTTRALAFPHVTVDALPELLASSSTLFIDVRPPGQHTAARLPNALSLSVPSIFLKRPLCTLERISAMLTSPEAQQRFNRWRETDRLIVYDADTSTLQEGNNVLGLLRKFAAETGATDTTPAYSGQLSWLKGGFQAVWKERSDLLDTKSLTDTSSDSEESPSPADESATGALTAQPAQPAETGSQFTAPKPTSARRLAGSPTMPHRPAVSRMSLAPSDASSSSNHGSSQQSSVISHPLGLPKKHIGSHISSSTSLSISRDRMSVQAANPFFDNIRQNMELSQGITERIPLRLPRRVRRRIGDLPFPWLREIASGALGTKNGKGESSSDSSLASEADLDTELPPSSAAESEGNEDEDGAGMLMTPAHAESSRTAQRRHHSLHHHHLLHHLQPRPGGRPPLPEMSAEAVEVGMENLAMQFFRIELAEQRRLMGVMEHHSKESDGWGESSKMGSALALDRTGKGKVRATRMRRGSMSNIDSSGTGSGTSSASASVTGSATGSNPNSNSNHSGPGTASGTPSSSDYGAASRELFPFSITAGVEKGAKNRYRNIWPFEHARVKLKAPNPKSPRSRSLSRSRSIPSLSSIEGEVIDDYVNASYVQPLCTRKRYIATQGPLDATFDDFWTLVWQQNVHVIVMLTREIEGSMVKCGCYWTDSVRYFAVSDAKHPSGKPPGTLRLELVSVEGHDRDGGDSRTGFFDFSMVNDPSAARSPASPIIKRTFLLTHSLYPEMPARRVVQLQYLEWPDMNVPDDPRGVLKLVKQLERECAEAVFPEGDDGPGAAVTRTRSGLTKRRSMDAKSGIATRALGRKNAPVLLHCSAGVGRTGGFIAIDAVLDGIRNDLRKKKKGLKRGTMSPGRDRDGDVVMGDARTQSGDSNLQKGLTMPIAPSYGGDIIHVPVVQHKKTPKTERRDKKDPTTPMQVDSGPSSNDDNFFGTGSAAIASPQGLTQKWAQKVSDEIHGMQSTAKAPTPPSEVEAGGGDGNVLKKRRRGQNVNARSTDSLVSDAASSGESRSGESGSGDSGSRESGSGVSGVNSTSASGSASSKGSSGISSGFGKTEDSSASSVLPEAEASIEALLKPPNLAVSKGSARPRPTSAPSGRTQDPLRRSPLSNGTSTSWLNRTMSNSPMPMTGEEEDQSDNIDMKSLSAHRPTVSRSGISGGSGDHQKLRTMVDYREPRPLHEDKSPIELSSFEEPLWEIVQDMREQRMSLCQSLRQYVFVHAAVLEGALMLADEERDRTPSEAESPGRESAEKNSMSSSMSMSMSMSISRGSNSPDSRQADESVVDEESPSPALTMLQLPVTKGPQDPAQLPPERFIEESSFGSVKEQPTPPLQAPEPMSSSKMGHPPRIDIGTLQKHASSAPVPSTARRMSGEDDGSSLLKRPSIKRKQRSSDEDSPGVEHDDSMKGQSGIGAHSLAKRPSVRRKPRGSSDEEEQEVVHAHPHSHPHAHPHTPRHRQPRRQEEFLNVPEQREQGSGRDYHP